MLAVLAPLVERGQRDGVFRRDVPAAWHLSMLLALVHAASGELSSGRIPTAQVEPALVASVLGRDLRAELSNNPPMSDDLDFIIVGEKVALGPLRRDLAGVYARWMNQAEVRRGLDYLGVSTVESQEKWVEDNIARGAEYNPKGVEFTVYDRGDSAPVGTAGLFGISHAHGFADFAIYLGERRGQGLGTEATRLALDFAFHVLQLRNVLLETLEWNVAGLTAYERAGFRRIGVRRGARVSRGRPTDIVLMDAVPEDFGPSVLGG